MARNFVSCCHIRQFICHKVCIFGANKRNPGNCRARCLRVIWPRATSHLAQEVPNAIGVCSGGKATFGGPRATSRWIAGCNVERVASTLGLSTSLLAEKLGIARRTVTRKQGSGTPLSPGTSGSFCGWHACAISVARCSRPDEAVSEWLSKSDASLGDMAPLDLLDTDLGAREVENLLRALAYGHFV